MEKVLSLQNMLEQEVKNRIVRAENNFIGFSFLVTIRFVEKLEERCHGSLARLSNP